MGKRFARKQLVNSYECLTNYKVSPTSIMNYFQETSQEQSVSLGEGPRELSGKGLAWFLIKYHIDFLSYPTFGQTVEVITEAKAFKGFIAHRYFAIKDQEGGLMVEGKTHWMMMNLETDRMMRMEAVPENAVYGVEDDAATYKIPNLKKMKDWEGHREFQVRYLDIDFNSHVNHVKYLAWAIEILPPERVLQLEVASVDIIYKKQAFYGDVVDVLYKEVEPNVFRVDIDNQEGDLLCQLNLVMRENCEDK